MISSCSLCFFMAALCISNQENSRQWMYRLCFVVVCFVLFIFLWFCFVFFLRQLSHSPLSFSFTNNENPWSLSLKFRSEVPLSVHSSFSSYVKCQHVSIFLEILNFSLKDFCTIEYLGALINSLFIFKHSVCKRSARREKKGKISSISGRHHWLF